jgi:glycosyltransferase involved in cell wall biosynthesis
VSAPRLRVASVITDLGIGGGENRLLAFARAVDRARVEHTVVSLYRPDEAHRARWGSVRQSFADAGIEVVNLEDRPRDRLLGPLTPGGILRTGRTVAGMLAKLCAVLRARRIDLIDAQHVTASVFGVAAGRLLGIPTTVTEYHTGYWNRAGMRAPGKVVLRLPDALICDSSYRLNEINRWLVAPHPRPVVIPNGVPEPHATRPRAEVLREFGIPDSPGTRVVCQVSRLVSYKGQRVLLRAAARVLRTRPEAYVVLVGYAGPELSYKSELETLARALGIAHRVRIQGYAGPVGDVWQIVDVHAHASLFDSAPIAITEGMARARPAVVTRVGGIPEMVTDGETGVVVPPDDPVSLARALAWLLDDPRAAQRLGRAARARYERRHRPEAMARALERLFADVVRARC